MKTLFAIFVCGLAIACNAAILNPDPAHGGACHDGNQLSTLCPDGSCAPPSAHCMPNGGWVIDAQDEGFGTKRDAGAIGATHQR